MRILGIVFAGVLLAAASGQSNATFAQTAAPAAETAKEMVDAEVKKVDKDAKKVTLKHGEIKSLDMPAMTMVFQVKEAAMLDKVKAGDKVRVNIQQTKSGYVVSAIEAAK